MIDSMLHRAFFFYFISLIENVRRGVAAIWWNNIYATIVNLHDMIFII